MTSYPSCCLRGAMPFKSNHPRTETEQGLTGSFSPLQDSSRNRQETLPQHHEAASQAAGALRPCGQTLGVKPHPAPSGLRVYSKLPSLFPPLQNSSTHWQGTATCPLERGAQGGFGFWCQRFPCGPLPTKIVTLVKS